MPSQLNPLLRYASECGRLCNFKAEKAMILFNKIKHSKLFESEILISVCLYYAFLEENKVLNPPRISTILNFTTKSFTIQFNKCLNTLRVKHSNLFPPYFRERNLSAICHYPLEFLNIPQRFRAEIIKTLKFIMLKKHKKSVFMKGDLRSRLLTKNIKTKNLLLKSKCKNNLFLISAVVSLNILKYCRCIQNIDDISRVFFIEISMLNKMSKFI